jgi:hypothetical protein
MWKPFVCAVLLVGACNAKTPRSQVDAIRGSDRIGVLDADLNATKKIAHGSGGGYVEWAGTDGAMMCATTDMGNTIRDQSAQKSLEAYEAGIKKSRVIFEAWDSASQVPEKWPTGGEGTIGSVVSHKVTNERHQDSGGEWRDWYMLDVVLKVCAPAPEIKATTRLITMTSLTGGKHKIYAWEIKGTPAPRSSGKREPPTETPSEPPATVTPSAVAPGSKTIIGALEAAGGYGEFLAVVACAGKQPELASGNLTVLAFTDEVVRKKAGSENGRKKLKTKCASIYAAHVSATALPASAFKAGESVEVKTLDGTSRTFQVEDGHVIEATNGVIYTVDQISGR